MGADRIRSGRRLVHGTLEGDVASTRSLKQLKRLLGIRAFAPQNAQLIQSSNQRSNRLTRKSNGLNGSQRSVECALAFAQLRV